LSDVFEEVEEGLRQDQVAIFAKKYGPYLIAIAVAFLASIGGWQVYQSWRSNNAITYADKMAAAQKTLAANKFAEAEKEFAAIAANAPAGYKAMAFMQMGAAHSGLNDMKAALADYDKAAAAAPDKTFADLARLKAAYIAADVEDFKALDARTKPLIEGGGALSFMARELIGVQAFANGDAARAREEFSFLTVALDAPQTLRQRAQISLAALGPKPVESATPEPAAAPAAAPVAPANGAKKP
jgi:hypothetical protein